MEAKGDLGKVLNLFIYLYIYIYIKIFGSGHRYEQHWFFKYYIQIILFFKFENILIYVLDWKAAGELTKLLNDVFMENWRYWNTRITAIGCYHN